MLNVEAFSGWCCTMKRFTGILAGILLVTVLLPFLGRVDVLAADGIPIDEDHFPDDDFRRVLSGTFYDKNGNGYFSDDEIELVRNIYCENENIDSVDGIEYFTDLQGLWCADNNISEWDLSSNTDLRGIWCSGNDFTSLDFSDNPELVWVYCFDCNLTELDVSENSKMAYIECNTNPLPELDLTGCPELEHLMCGSCELTELNLSYCPNLQHLDCFRNHLTELDVSVCPDLKRLDCWDNEDLEYVDVSNNPGLQTFNCANIGATEINVSNNPELTELHCSYNDLTELDLSNNPNLVYLDCADNALEELDVSSCPRLYFLQAFINSFTSINIGNNCRLIKTYNDGSYEDVWGIAGSWSIDYGNGILYFLSVDNDVSVSTSYSGTPDYVPDYYYDSNDGLSGDLVTREELMQELYELAGSPPVYVGSRYTDVPSGSSYADAIAWGEIANINTGYPYIHSDTFGYGEYISREDAALMMYRYSETMHLYSAFDYGRTDEFSDFYDISYHTWGAVTWAIQWGILEPYGDPDAANSERSIAPHSRVTEDDMEDMIDAMLEKNSGYAGYYTPVLYGWLKDKNGDWKYFIADVPVTSDWVRDGSTWYYLDSNGNYVKGWQKVGNSWYYFSSIGAMQKGWKQISGKWYYLKSSGVMATGWNKIGNKWYYFESSGTMVSGWKKIGSTWYYFNSSGDMATGWKQISGKWYYFESSGAMKTGWLKYRNNWYYFKSGGEMVTGSYKISGTTYNFDSSGICTNP